MQLPSQKRILREDVKDAPSWVNGILDPVNSFMEIVYQGLNHDITFSENIRSFVKELTIKTPSTYPVMTDTKFLNELKVNPTGVLVMQAYNKTLYTPVSVGNISWMLKNGEIIISPISGLAADETYVVRLLII